MLFQVVYEKSLFFAVYEKLLFLEEHMADVQRKEYCEQLR